MINRRSIRDGSSTCSPAAFLRRIMGHLPGLAALFTMRRSLESRQAAFPRKGLPCDAPVRIRWNQYQVPYIQARSDHDLAFVLGLVHAHLREGQLAMLKYAALGRLAEISAPRQRGLTNCCESSISVMRWMRSWSRCPQAPMPGSTPSLGPKPLPEKGQTSATGIRPIGAAA